MFKLFSKLRSLKLALKVFNARHYGGLPIKVAAAKAKLDAIQKEAQSNSNLALLKEEQEALEEYIHLALAEESFYKQKARDNSIKVGDQNTSYFHRKVKAHCSRNKILSIVNNQGARIEDYEEVKVAFIKHYKKLLGTTFNYPKDAKQYVNEVTQTSLPMDFFFFFFDNEEITLRADKASRLQTPRRLVGGPHHPDLPMDLISSLDKEITND